MLPGRVPAAAARLSRPGDSRSVAEALYEESLGDDAGYMLCELLDLHANRTGQNTARHAAFYLAPMNVRLDNNASSSTQGLLAGWTQARPQCVSAKGLHQARQKYWRAGYLVG